MSQTFTLGGRHYDLGQLSDKERKEVLSSITRADLVNQLTANDIRQAIPELRHGDGAENLLIRLQNRPIDTPPAPPRPVKARATKPRPPVSR